MVNQSLGEPLAAGINHTKRIVSSTYNSSCYRRILLQLVLLPPHTCTILNSALMGCRS